MGHQGYASPLGGSLSYVSDFTDRLLFSLRSYGIIEEPVNILDNALAAVDNPMVTRALSRPAEPCYDGATALGKAESGLGVTVFSMSESDVASLRKEATE